MFVLPVQFDQPIREVLECLRGGHGSVDEGPASSLRGDFAADHDLGTVRFENRFDRRQFCPGADQILRGSSAKEKADGFDEDGFASAGLTRQDVERWFKFDGDRLDDRQVANCEISNHDVPAFHERPGAKRGKSIESKL